MFPEVLSNLQQKLESWHDKLYHIHTKSMFRLEKLGAPPKNFQNQRMMYLFMHRADLEQQG